MRIAVVGAGGVGGGFGAALAKAGADVTFIARGAHLAAMKSAGLKVQGGRGETHLVPTQATDDPADDRRGRYRAVLRQAVGRRKRRRAHQAADRPEHRCDPAAERHRRRRAADPDPRQGCRDGRRGADLGLDHRPRRDPAGRHLHAHDLRRTRRQDQQAGRGFSRALRQSRLRCCHERADRHRPLDEVHPARQPIPA